MIGKELEIKIKQHHFRDKWSIGTIATQLSIHPDTVKRVIENSAKKESKSSIKVLPIEAHREFIERMLVDYPTIRATRLLDMLKKRGYTGSVYPIRRLKHKLAPQGGQAYLDLKFMPGEQAQVDWGSFGHMMYGTQRRPLHAFVMVLCYSRRIYARFFHDMKSARVQEGHRRAIEYFGGSARTIVYDNMKTAVLENLGAAVRFNPDLLELAAYYNFEPRACNPRSGWEKEYAAYYTSFIF